MAVQGPVINWVADHRKHHAHTDEEGDPHSPHVGAGKGVKGAVRGLLHAHVGWLLTEHGRAERAKYARDLVEDRGMRVVDKGFVGWVLLGLALPAALGWLITGSYTGALTGLLWGGLVRVFLLHHVTWSINSVCHFFGRRRFATEDKSTNVWWLALPSFGEAWHHNHHAFPRSATHGLRPARARPVGRGDLDDGEAGPGLGRGEDHARAPGPAPRALAARHGVTPGGWWSCPSLKRRSSCFSGSASGSSSWPSLKRPWCCFSGSTSGSSSWPSLKRPTASSSGKTSGEASPSAKPSSGCSGWRGMLEGSGIGSSDTTPSFVSGMRPSGTH